MDFSCDSTGLKVRGSIPLILNEIKAKLVFWETEVLGLSRSSLIAIAIVLALPCHSTPLNQGQLHTRRIAPIYRSPPSQDESIGEACQCP